ncbi:MAG: alpha/beta hydrolase [Euryarchaeota archaeon]|nr:alpha/beta hydrolase [Euryarchaeota archaeon]MBV1729474.1 alpha/beta hydrolase [Methanobacterium sp.]MBU4548126.1 alpha/beta hydrolase [Euryarchaeota archaeon]MBU4608324.1 alpha/beta hydrolase [Euryarchaeota archaeon]MBV1756160.1 alpha/beta hydrolase [Methanobacterium sp.]
MEKTQFKFPVGYHKFHQNQLFNYQLNRWYSWGYARLEDMEYAGLKIDNFQDWKNIMIKLAQTALQQDRLINAAFYYRAAEFYTFSHDPDKEILYDKFCDLFYNIFQDEGLERFKVPYHDGFLPVIKTSPEGKSKGTIVLHGGFDSCIEEFYSWMWYFSSQGYEVIGFEGPGQGLARKKYGIPLDIEWEKPTAAVLDYFNLDDVTLIGISMGGWFCLRAAAFEPRIKKVIAQGHALDYMKIPNILAQKMLIFFIKYFPNFSNKITLNNLKKCDMEAWTTSNLMYITDKKDALRCHGRLLLR